MKEYITADSVANAVRMKRSLHAGTFLIVEGGDDKMFFDRFVDHESCRIEIGFGKHNVVGAIRTLNASGFAGFLGVADADFRRVTMDGVDEANLVFTDEHDLECMLLRSTALERLLAEFGVANRVEAFAKQHGPVIGNTVALAATPLGCLLLVSLRHDHGLIFDELSVQKFVRPSSLQIDLDALLAEVRNKSQKHSLDWKSIQEEVIVLAGSCPDPWQVACGHHMIEILSVALRRTFASHTAAEVAPKILAKCLRLAYHLADFVLTRLYRAIRSWEDANRPFQILQA
jgi:hypothetical protein